MRRYLAVTMLLLLAAACGKKEDASPLDVLPESGFMMVAISDPTSIVSIIDDYIEQGVPIAGPDLLAKQIFEATSCTSLDSLTAMMGVDVHGTTVFYAAGINPQTIGAALPVPDPETFWLRTAEWGAEWTDVEAIDGTLVKTFSSGDMTVFVSTYRGLALFAGSRSEISTMIDRIEGRAPHASVTVTPSTIWMKLDVSMVGPMASGQLNMYRPQILSGMQSEMTGNPSEAMIADMVELYLDAIDIFLLQTKYVEYTVTFGPENIDANCLATFTPGSTLATLMHPVEAADHLSMLPASDVMAARISMPPELSSAAAGAVFEALGVEVDQTFIDLTAQMSSNTSFAMYDDAFMHFMAVYEMPEGSDLTDVQSWIEFSIALSQDLMQGVEGIAFSAPRDTVIDGIQYLTYGTAVDPSMIAGGQVSVTAQEVPAMAFTVWLAPHEDLLVMEMAPEPMLIAEVINGTYAGETMGGDAFFAGAGSDKEMVFGMNFPAYMAVIFDMMGEEAGFDPSALSESEAWMYYTVDFTDQGVACTSTIDGSDMAEMIGIMATSANPGALGAVQ